MAGAGAASEMPVAFAPAVPLSLARPHPHPHPRVSRTRPPSRRPRSAPAAFAEPDREAATKPSAPKACRPHTRAPVPWLERALLTVFEPATELSAPPPPRRATSRWQVLWESLQALYGLRLRPPRSARRVPPLPLPSHPVETESPEFVAATGLDPHRCLARTVVFVADVLADAVVFEIISRIDKPLDVVELFAGVLAAYATADLVSGLYNWLRLNFSPNAAIFGEADERSGKTSFSRLVAPHCAAVAPVFALMLATPPGDIRVDAFVCYLMTFLSLLPAFREWNGGEHRPPQFIWLLQEAGIVIRRSSTSSFHKLEYCIVCGMWDGIFTRVRLFSNLERWIYLHSGGRIRPRVWDIMPEARERACGPNDVLLRQNER